ncbi:TnsD family Tn7-like transposition protein [Cupriavidus sp. BIS7]|uniref:TnsD family Tn7-like transposition protein n=1 Tax=Cupriavidus sp. BIS7 TaxID=1217718 RepID=UPI0002FCF192|nr:TnsD family Tn7-like transposition protein [Cupriavidus sp. BIS7]
MTVYIERPYEDELLFSVCMRHFVSNSTVPYRILLKELFGKEWRVAPYFPSGIGIFSDRTSFSIGLSKEEIFYNHTMYPAVCAYMPDEKYGNILNSAVVCASFASRKACLFPSFNPPALLRWCPDCVNSDRNTCGEAYWRRAHQLPCVWKCHIHKVDLVSACLEYADLRRINIIPAETFIPMEVGTYREISRESPEERLLRERLVGFLNGVRLDKRPHHPNYRDAAVQAGLWAAGEVNYERVFEEFERFWGNVLSRIDIRQNYYSPGVAWIRTVFMGARPLWNPMIRELLHIFFTVKFNVDPDAISPRKKRSGRTFYYCPNPYAEHGRGMPARYSLSFQKDKTLVALRCECGFCGLVSKSWANREISLADVVRVTRYGDAWKMKAKALKASGMKFIEIAQRLGVSVYTARYWARDDTLKPATSHDELMRLRHEWNATLQAVAPQPWSMAIRKRKQLYRRLFREDAAWLKEVGDAHNKKYGRRRNPPGRVVDWTLRDEAYRTAVIAASFRLQQRGMARPPTRNELMHEAGIPSRSKEELRRKLPCTDAELTRLTQVLARGK